MRSRGTVGTSFTPTAGNCPKHTRSRQQTSDECHATYGLPILSKCATLRGNGESIRLIHNARERETPMATQKYYTTTGLRIDLRKMHPDDSVALRCDYPNADTKECQERVDYLVRFYHSSFRKLILMAGQ